MRRAGSFWAVLLCAVLALGLIGNVSRIFSQPEREKIHRTSLSGIVPGSDPGETVEKLNALLSQGGTILVDVPGVYEIDDTLLIGSNTALVCSEGVSFRQTRDVGGVILNKGALTREYDIGIVIDGLNVICDGHWSSSSTYVPGLCGKIALYYTRDSVIRNVTCSDVSKEAYFIHVSRFDNLLIEGCVISGFKDGIHVSTGDGLTIRGCRISTKDDPIALNAHDYVNGCPELGDIRNVLIENCVNASDNREFMTNNFPGYSSYAGGRGMLLLGGGWLDWAEGNTYRRSDAVVSNGSVYQLDAPDSGPDAGREYSSTVVPTHSMGSETYADGLTWVWKGNATYSSTVQNLTVRNYRFEAPHEALFYSYLDCDEFSRSVYPGAYAPPHRNLTFENVTVNPEYWYHCFVFYRYPADEVTIRNCSFTGRTILRINTDKHWETIGGNDRFRARICDSTFVLGNNPQGSPYVEPMLTVQSYVSGSYTGDTPVTILLAAAGNTCPQTMGNSISDNSAKVIASGTECDLLDLYGLSRSYQTAAMITSSSAPYPDTLNFSPQPGETYSVLVKVGSVWYGPFVFHVPEVPEENALIPILEINSGGMSGGVYFLETNGTYTVRGGTACTVYAEKIS